MGLYSAYTIGGALFTVLPGHGYGPSSLFRNPEGFLLYSAEICLCALHEAAQADNYYLAVSTTDKL